jgi:hypothetical protein
MVCVLPKHCRKVSKTFHSDKAKDKEEVLLYHVKAEPKRFDAMAYDFFVCDCEQ